MPRGGIQVGLAKGGWLHIYLPPLVSMPFNKVDEIADLETYHELVLPEDFRTFYLTTNGIQLFHSAIQLHGWSNKRTELFTKTVLSNHKTWKLSIEDKEPHQWIFGHSHYFYNTRCYFYLDLNTQEIFRTENEYTMTPLHRWTSLKEMLLTEYERLELLYDKSTGERLEPVPVLIEAWDEPYRIRFDFPASEAELEELYRRPKAFNLYGSTMLTDGTPEQLEAFQNWFDRKNNE